jgi:hypothetical protein
LFSLGKIISKGNHEYDGKGLEVGGKLKARITWHIDQIDLWLRMSWSFLLTWIRK